MALFAITHDYETIDCSNTCPFCGKVNMVSVPHDQFINWQKGELIMRAFPELSPADREILKTGICDDCFPKDDC